jgi:hypothetical protein
MNLTQNFTLSEMTKSETALRFGMANDPSKPRLKTFASCAKTFYNSCGITTAWGSRSIQALGIRLSTPR